MRWFDKRNLISFLGSLIVALASPAFAEPAATLIFFDSGKPVITRDAEDVLDEAIKAGSAQSRWTIIGFADRSGPESANNRMALARAQATMRYLVEHGIPAQSIEVHSKGESGPVIPTADGVREPQNRRVEIQVR